MNFWFWNILNPKLRWVYKIQQSDVRSQIREIRDEIIDKVEENDLVAVAELNKTTLMKMYQRGYFFSYTTSKELSTDYMGIAVFFKDEKRWSMSHLTLNSSLIRWNKNDRWGRFKDWANLKFFGKKNELQLIKENVVEVITAKDYNYHVGFCHLPVSHQSDVKKDCMIMLVKQFIKSQGCNFVLCGDFNIDVSVTDPWKEDQKSYKIGAYSIDFNEFTMPKLSKCAPKHPTTKNIKHLKNGDFFYEGTLDYALAYNPTSSIYVSSTAQELPFPENGELSDHIPLKYKLIAKDLVA